MIQFLKDHWLGLIGVVITVASLGFAVFTYFESQIERRPTVIIDPTQPKIISADPLLEAPIRVSKADGTPIESNLYTARFYFWNDGEQSIKPENVLKPLKISLQDSTAEILDHRLVSTSRDVTRLQLTADSSSTPLRKLNLSFDILEHEDGATGQILYQADSVATFHFSGIVENAEPLQITTNYGSQSAILETLKNVLSFVAVISLMSFFLLRMMPKLESESRRRKKFILIVIGIFLFLMTCVLIYYTYRENIQESSLNPTKQVPTTIIESR